ncbi:hypothetical protein EIP91_010026 [Steccherinum ochraceum]|uniref:Metallo-beta-lactamase domain-containing protein n=1 Tax=Steccherinum ochraceum TaxID=92696 RepID=A0A4R0RA94_9APHY|nr:hypothetical protein EIP91_010026 [Steccherinum ochraceum]
MASYRWSLPFFTSSVSNDSTAQPRRRYALIILNQPFAFGLFKRLWEAAEWKCCADGGANRLHDACLDQNGQDVRAKYLPELIKGDLDSLRSDVKEYYASQGVPIIQDEDQNATDLMKCIRELSAKEDREGTDRYELIVLGGLSGRLDQTIHTLSLLHKLRKSGRRIYAVNDENVAWVLDQGDHFIEIDHALFGQTCGMLPVGVDSLSSLPALLISRHPGTGLDKVLESSQWSVEAEMVENPDDVVLKGGEEVAVICPHPYIYVKILDESSILIIDTGCGGKTDRPEINLKSLREFIETVAVADNGGKALNEGGRRGYIVVLTHCHFDHILGVEQFAADSQILVSGYAPKFNSSPELAEHSLCSDMGIELPKYSPTYVADGYTIRSLQGNIHVLHTPGHTPDELALWDEGEHMLYVGDTLYEWVPIIFPREGSIVDWFKSVDALLALVWSSRLTTRRSVQAMSLLLSRPKRCGFARREELYGGCARREAGTGGEAGEARRGECTLRTGWTAVQLGLSFSADF